MNKILTHLVLNQFFDNTRNPQLGRDLRTAYFLYVTHLIKISHRSAYIGDQKIIGIFEKKSGKIGSFWFRTCDQF